MSSDSFFLPGVGIPSVRRGDYIDGTLGVLGAGNIAIHGDKSGKHELFGGLQDTLAVMRNDQRWNNENRNYGRSSTDYANGANNAIAKGRNDASEYGQHGLNWDQNNNVADRAAKRTAASSYGANKWGQSNNANHALNDELWSKGNQWYQGRRKDDDIVYAFDKNFFLSDTDHGGFELAESTNSHARDEMQDHAASYDRDTEKDAAWASASDAQKAERRASAVENAGASDSNWDKFAQNAASHANDFGKNKNFANKIDKSQGADQFWTNARKSASDEYENLVSADGSKFRNTKFSEGRHPGSPDHLYAYGLAGHGGYAAKPGYEYPYVVDYARSGPTGSAAKAWDRTAKTGLRHLDDALFDDRKKTTYSNDQWLQDRVQGFGRNKDTAVDNKGFSDWARNTVKAVNKADENAALAASKLNKDEAKSKFDEELWSKDAAKKRLSDRNSNKRVYKKWFNDKNRGGKNWERLTYDRDQADDAFGYDTSAKKEWNRRTNDGRWNERSDANGKNINTAQANDASRNAFQSDWKKDVSGYENEERSAYDKDALNRKGYNNAAWKRDQIQAAIDLNNHEGKVYDRDFGRRGIDSRMIGTIGGKNVDRYYGSLPYSRENYNYGYPGYSGYPTYHNGYTNNVAYGTDHVNGGPGILYY